MDTTPWRERVRAEEELLEQLSLQTVHAARRRAQALQDGVAELGSAAAVAADLGDRSHQAVTKAIRKNRAAEADRTTE
ncbi:hypothetical protein OHB04_22730 [Streptomyces sp. NBC_01775]|uniref:hypothetical protein n=1 Tax=Streptomyces sp. NBC_01775 TaxID=2975939 RepID=UPI002DDBE35D|nr:hypothetical protein [Streptomyces sp. NBC_01775]WSB78310.1 hypothetical protein OHB04_22730 [Streptomyces sp. NBC_01775]